MFCNIYYLILNLKSHQGWPGLGDGYCHVERHRSWKWIKLMRQREGGRAPPDRSRGCLSPGDPVITLAGTRPEQGAPVTPPRKPSSGHGSHTRRNRDSPIRLARRGASVRTPTPGGPGLVTSTTAPPSGQASAGSAVSTNRHAALGLHPAQAPRRPGPQPVGWHQPAGGPA